MICERCGRRYDKIFNSIVRLDYEMPGKGKSYEWHLCTRCRKNLVRYIERKGALYSGDK